jgi:hypothetical protein
MEKSIIKKHKYTWDKKMVLRFINKIGIIYVMIE